MAEEKKEQVVHSIEDMDALLGESLESISDLIEYETPPAGRYKVKLAVEKKAINKKPGVALDYEILEVAELANAAEAPPKVGQHFSEFISFATDPQKAKEVIKARFKECVPASMSVVDALAAVNGMTLNLTVTIQKGKDAEGNLDGKLYPRIKNVLPA
jgi:hypothetical protein